MFLMFVDGGSYHSNSSAFKLAKNHVNMLHIRVTGSSHQSSLLITNTRTNTTLYIQTHFTKALGRQRVEIKCKTIN